MSSDNTFSNKSPAALYSANSRYKQKLLTGKTPTAEETNAHNIIEQRKAQRGTGVTPNNMYTPSAISPRSSARFSPVVNTVYTVPFTPTSSPQSPRGRSKKSTGVRSPRVLSPEAREKAILNVTNARYSKKIKNGQIPTAEETRAHEIVEANKINSPRVQSPVSTLSAEEKKYQKTILVANARYAKKIKNGGVPTQDEIDAHNIIETRKVETLSPRNTSYNTVSSPRRLIL